MKKKLPWIVTVLIILGIIATVWIGGFLTTPPTKETIFKGEAPAVFGSASDRTQGLYQVEYWLVQKGPWPNKALLPQTAQFYWSKPPTLADVKAVVRMPLHFVQYKYTFCDDCPLRVTTLRQPVTPREPTEPIEEDTKHLEKL
jgi:hypothetical protein